MSSTNPEGVSQRHPTTGSNPNPSIESARRFLYDEDEDPVVVVPTSSGVGTNLGGSSGGGAGNTPLPHPKDIRAHAPKRLNPVVAACMACCTTCRTMGIKSFLLALVIILIFFVTITGVVSLKDNGEINHKKRMKSLTNQILSSRISTQEQLDDPDSPQYHALHYVSNIDTTTPDLGSTDEGTAIALQKYALAVFFYSLSPDDKSHHDPISGWKRQDDWISWNVGMCQWYGIKCELDSRGPTFNGNADITSILLSENTMHGTLPSELRALTKLLNFDVSHNFITGSLPNGWAGDVATTTTTSNGPALMNLRSLVMTGNELQGTIPEDYGNFASLRMLYLGRNQLDGTIPKTLQHITTLQTLSVESNQLEGNIPDFEDTIKLAFLHLDDNKFVGSLPISLSKLSSLVAFGVSGNHITGTIPQEFELLHRLQRLYLNDNNLRGSLPDIFTKTTRLVDFHIYNNSFTGQLPSTFGHLKDMKSFKIGDNKFSGTFPRLLVTMPDLEVLSFENNNIGGSLSYLIATMRNLKEFDGQSNELVGSMPTELGDLHHLNILRLANNQMTGNIPTQLGHLKLLHVLQLHGNNFSGSVPVEACSLVNDEALDVLSVDCSTGSIQCDCCTCF